MFFDAIINEMMSSTKSRTMKVICHNYSYVNKKFIVLQKSRASTLYLQQPKVDHSGRRQHQALYFVALLQKSWCTTFLINLKHYPFEIGIIPLGWILEEVNLV